MPQICPLFPLFLLAGMLQSSRAAIHTDASLSTLPLSELEQQRVSIDAELEQLANYSLRSGTGSVGYQSKPHHEPDQNERVRIDLGAEFPVDQVVLIPSIRRNPRSGLQAEAFPIAFRLRAGTQDRQFVLATFTAEDKLLPRIAPLVMSFPPANVSWIEVEATTLSERGEWDNRQALHLAELMVFSGMENVALNKTVSATSSLRISGRDTRFLVDGFVPYLMDSNQKSRSRRTTLTTQDKERQPALTIDLGSPQPVNQINFHMAFNHDLIIPNPIPNDQTAPQKIRVTGANRADFSDQQLLFEYQQHSIYDAGPIITRRFQETVCRYIKIHILELQPTIYGLDKFAVSFAEIEILSKGENIATGKKVTCSGISSPPNALARITDGKNFLGQILPMRIWMNQLARRHELERERPRIESELNRRYARHQVNLNRMYWLLVLLSVTIGVSILIARMAHRSQLERIRNRFAADLHDELGANLHAIGLLGDLAKEAVHSPSILTETVNEIRSLTERTSTAARHCADIYEAKLSRNLRVDMERTAQRILVDIPCELSIEGDAFLQKLKPRTQADLFLFYKESLVNVSRHSGATRCSIHLVATASGTTLTTADNGKGLPGTSEKVIPTSLQRRAKMLKAKLTIESPRDGGTQITLRLRTCILFSLFTNPRSGPRKQPQQEIS